MAAQVRQVAVDRQVALSKPVVPGPNDWQKTTWFDRARWQDQTLAPSDSGERIEVSHAVTFRGPSHEPVYHEPV